MLHFDSVVKEVPTGLVADFCPICWKPQKFLYWELHRVQRFNLLPLGRDVVGGIIRCHACRFPRYVLERRYQEAVTEEVPFDELVARTFPTLPSVYERQMKIGGDRESRLRLSDNERQRVISEVLYAIAPSVEVIYANPTAIDRHCLMGCLTTLLVGAASVVLAILLPELPFLFAVPIVIFVAGTIFTFWGLVRQNRRAARRLALPLCGQGLSHLQTDPAEISACLRDLRRTGWKLGRVLSANAILKAMRQQGPNAGK